MFVSFSTALMVWAMATAGPSLESSSGLITMPVEVDEEVEKTCRLLSNRLASVGRSECLQLALEPTEGQSVENIAIVAREYPPVTADTEAAGVAQPAGQR